MNARFFLSAVETVNEFGHKIFKKLVLAWDPDYTKVTPEEARQIEEAEKSGFVRDQDIDWSKIGV